MNERGMGGGESGSRKVDGDVSGGNRKMLIYIGRADMVVKSIKIKCPVSPEFKTSYIGNSGIAFREIEIKNVTI